MRGATFILGRIAVAIGGAAALLAIWATPATAISRSAAEQLALNTLGTAAKPAPIALFGLNKPVKPKNGKVTITEPDTSDKKMARAFEKAGKKGQLRFRSRLIYRSGKPAWVFWEDLEHGAMFEHDSTVLIIDDRSGKVVEQKALRWYPAINGEEPPFLRKRSDYFGDKHKVFSNAAPRPAEAERRSSRSALTAVAGSPATKQASDPATVARDHLGAERACFVSIINAVDKRFKPDRTFLALAIPAAGYTAYTDVKPRGAHAGPDGKALKQAVNDLVRQGKCKSVTIYVSGHGWDEQRLVKGKRLPANVDMGRQMSNRVTTADVVTAQDLRDVFTAHPTVEFTLIVNACFAGTFADEFKDRPATKKKEFDNVEQTIFSSSATQKSWFALSLPRSTNPTDVSEFLFAFVQGLIKFGGDAKETNNAWIEIGKNHPSFAAYQAERAYRLGLPQYFPDSVPAGQRGHTDSSSDTRGNSVPNPATANNAGGKISYDGETPSKVNLEVAVVGDGFSELKVMVPAGAGPITAVSSLEDADGNTYACSAATTESPLDTYSCSGSIDTGMYEGSVTVSSDPYFPMEPSTILLVNGGAVGPFTLDAPSVDGYAQHVPFCDSQTIADGVHILNSLFKAGSVCSFDAKLGEGKGGTVDYDIGISTGSQLDVNEQLSPGTWVSVAGMRDGDIPRFALLRSGKLPLIDSRMKMGGNSYWQAQFTTTSVVAGNPTTPRADSAALDFTPDCNGPTATLKSVAFGALVADPGGGGRTLKNLRRFDGGAAAINAQLVAPPVFGGGGKLTLEYAGCGKLALKSFVPLSAIGIKGKVTGISDKVAKQLVEISDRGKHAKGAKVKTLSKADRLHNPTPELEPGSASKRQMAGISINYSRTDGRHLVKIAPRPRIVGFVQDCLKDGGKPVFFKSKVDGKRVPAIRCD